MKGVPDKVARTTGTVAIANWGRVMVATAAHLAEQAADPRVRRLLRRALGPWRSLPQERGGCTARARSISAWDGSDFLTQV